MRLFLGIVVLSLLVSCNEIEGRLQVFSDFSLTADNGEEVEIVAGAYDANFSFDALDLEYGHEISHLTLGISGVDAGLDRVFTFKVPRPISGDEPYHYIDMTTDTDRDVEISAEESGQNVTLSVHTVTAVSKMGPHEYYVRCDDDYAYNTGVYNLITRRMNVSVDFSRDGKKLAAFTGSKEVSELKVLDRWWYADAGPCFSPDYDEH